MFSRDCGWNVAGLLRLVISSVFDGGEGDIKGGREDRSMESGVPGALDDFDMPLVLGEEVGDAGGDMAAGGIIVLLYTLELLW